MAPPTFFIQAMQARVFQKKLLCLLLCAAILTAAVSLYATRGAFIEKWHCWRLKSSNPETRLSSAVQLGSMGTPGAMEAILEALRAEKEYDPKLTLCFVLAQLDREAVLEMIRRHTTGDFPREEGIARYARPIIETLTIMEPLIGRDHPREIKTMDDMRRLRLYVDDFISKIH